MAAFVNGVSRHLCRLESNSLKILLGQQNIIVNSTRSHGFFRHLAGKKEHNETDYQYEVSNDPNEWKFVECLLPLTTVPEPTKKSVYPSGWRPMKEEALKLPYFAERSKNHMLPVYLQVRERGQLKYTRVKNIQGDIWAFHDELKEHLENLAQKRIASYVHEGNCNINFKGDHVYFVEQWMLNKGF